MKVIARNRKSGKTTDLIKESYSTGAYILVHHPSQADMIKRQAEKMGMDSLPYPITLNDLSRNVSMYNKTKGILIDNAELVLQSLIPVPINTITVSTTERRRRKKLISESEETKVKKDKQWLRDRYESMETIKVTTKNSRGKRSTSYLKKKTVINLLNQLDDPETTIHDAHDKIREVSPLTNKSFDYYWNAINDGVEIDEHLGDTQKLEKVQIPQFVADYFSDFDGNGIELFDYILKYQWNEDAGYDDTLPRNVEDWIFESNENIVLALELSLGSLAYEVEEEQKYYVLDKDNIIMIGKVNNGKVMKRNFHTPFNNFNEPAKEKAQLTEQEIKDYDERFWPFAVKVEELEE